MKGVKPIVWWGAESWKDSEYGGFAFFPSRSTGNKSKINKYHIRNLFYTREPNETLIILEDTQSILIILERRSLFLFAALVAWWWTTHYLHCLSKENLLTKERSNVCNVAHFEDFHGISSRPPPVIGRSLEVDFFYRNWPK